MCLYKYFSTFFFFYCFFYFMTLFSQNAVQCFFQNNSLFSLNIKVFSPKTLKTMFLKYSLFSVNITTFLQNITYFFSKYYNFFLWLWQLFLITLQLYFENIMTLQCSENSITFSCNIKGFFQNTFSQKIYFFLSFLSGSNTLLKVTQQWTESSMFGCFCYWRQTFK